MMRFDLLILSQPLWLEMQEHVRAETPLEACGLVAGHGNRAEAVYRVSNALKSPVQFRMDAREQLLAMESIEASGLSLLAIYHSHPNGSGTPSETDLAEWRYEAICLIWAPNQAEWQVRAFWLDPSSAAEIPIEMIDL